MMTGVTLCKPRKESKVSMEYIVNGSQAREIDRCSIQEIGIPSMVLMEKAAMSVASCIMAQADKKQDRILVVCGTGNNGGDGVAAARMLRDAGYIASVLVLGQEERCSEEMKQQISIARHLGCNLWHWIIERCNGCDCRLY